MIPFDGLVAEAARSEARGAQLKAWVVKSEVVLENDACFADTDKGRRVAEALLSVVMTEVAIVESVPVLHPWNGALYIWGRQKD